GSATVQLASQTTPATATILLGSYDGVTGKVIAEGTTQPSVGTRVIIQYNGQQLEARTDATASYTSQRIPPPLPPPPPPPGSLPPHLIVPAPDAPPSAGSHSASRETRRGPFPPPALPPASPPPRLLGIFPADGASKVAPDTQLKFTFNRAIQNSQMTTSYFH